MNSRFKWTIVGSSTCVAVLLLIGARTGRAVSTDDAYSHLKVYTEVLERIKLEYVEEPDMKSVTLGAIDGLLESVDPFASYLSPDEYRQYLLTEETAKGGVGVILAKRYGYVAVVDSIPGSPADKANLSTGDLIESINGVATRDMPLAYAEQLLRGAPNSTIEISLLRLRTPDPQKIKLTRAAVELPAVTAKLMPDNVGYVHVFSVAEGRVEAAKAEIQKLKKAGAKYIVLDLRHCSTGAQANGIGLANLFLEKGEIASLRGQTADKKQFEAQPENTVWTGPVVVINDRATAGGAEIASAALLDDKRAQIVGERSYGDASLRKTIEMKNGGGAIILSVAKYYSPSGKAIQDSGVTPSVPITETDIGSDNDEDGTATAENAPKPTGDTLLKQAVELVTGRATLASLNGTNANPESGTVAGAPPPIIQKAPAVAQPH